MGPYEALLRRMFDEMVIPRDASKISQFYHPDFWMSTNQIEQGYDEFYADHVAYYADEAQRSYAVEYDSDSFVEAADGVAGRLWITTQQGAGDPTRIEVLLVAKYRDQKIHRLWELTMPNWSTMPEFSD